MSEKPIPQFRSIAAPLDVDDAALERVNDELGVPKLTRPRREETGAAASPLPNANAPVRAPLEKVTIEVPSYLADALRRTALERRSSVRHVVMVALKEAGFEVAAADLVPDGRRRRAIPR